MAHLIDMGVRLKLEGVAAASDYLTKTMSEQQGGPNGGSVTLLRPDGTQFPGSPFKSRYSRAVGCGSQLTAMTTSGFPTLTPRAVRLYNCAAFAPRTARPV